MHDERDIEIRRSIDHLFRRYAGQMVSILTRRFGVQHLELVEDCVQDALLAAMKRWPFSGEPENPRAWLIAAAKNRAIDILRREKSSQAFDKEIRVEAGIEGSKLSGEIEEDELRMIFACCHPAISPDAQVALTLKTVGGFSVAEIASAFLSNDEAIAKMLTRAKAKLRTAAEDLEIPSQGELIGRRDAVMKVLYLMFNEGYSASAGEVLIRRDLCFEAIRLGTILAAHPLAGSPKVDALLALFCFQAARLDTRIDENGELMLLEDQDRSLWNATLLAKGLLHFQLSASGDEVSEYHLEAEIAAIHSLASDFVSTDWKRVIQCYDELQRRRFSPIVELNRIVAIERCYGAAAAMSAFDRLSKRTDISRYSLFYITRAHLAEKNGDIDSAKKDLQTAVSLTANASVQRFINRRLNALAECVADT